ncbi:hydrolase [Arthrobacter phage Sarge]|uniref:Glycoside hydrolase n=1 Tax=Arthrobacter phage Sarge TaxID=2885974 RepID=A0AAE9C1W0_9CAUD|nr:hydrolase [Arthrobacter phage Sarge]UDL14873.1 glycoside hydrolase [Arthrobacter phage Sarge]
MAYMKDSKGRRLDAYTPLSTSALAVTMPSGLGWDTTNFPFIALLRDYPGTPRSMAELNTTPEAIFDAYSTARSAPGATFYVSNSGLDTNNGTTAGTPFKSIWKAVAAANTAAVPSKIIVAAGTYFRTNNPWYNGGTGVIPTVDIAFIADGGRVITGTMDPPGTPTKDATQTNCYSYAVSSVNRVQDMVNFNAFGNQVEYQNVATAALCNATPNSWNLTSGTLYINRRDGAAVTNTTTRVFRPSTSCFTFSNPVNIYIGGTAGNDGWDCEGGSNIGVLAAFTNPPGTTRHVLIVKNSTFKYGGGVSDTVTRGVSVEGWQGLAWFSNCRADANQTDGFNFHNVYGATNRNGLTTNCTGYDNGRYPNQSNQGLTTHEDWVHVDIAGHYAGNHGGTVRCINTSKTWLAGTWVENDLGDQAYGGSVPPTAFRVDDTAVFWCDRTKVTMPAGGYSYVVSTGTAAIHKRDAWPSPHPDTPGTGTIDSY